MSNGRQFTTVAVDEATSARLDALGAHLDEPKIEVLTRAVASFAVAILGTGPVPVAEYRNRGGALPKAITNERLVDALCRLRETVGKSPSASEWDAWDGRLCNSKILARRLGKGSWSAALKAAGMSTRRPGSLRQYENDDLLQMLKDWYQRYGDSPTQAGWDSAHPGGPNNKVFGNRWGTWTGALAAAGLPYRNNGGMVKAQRLGRNRQMVTGGIQGAKRREPKR